MVAAVVARYSFDQSGRWLAEDRCDPKLGPAVPDVVELDKEVLHRKLAMIRQNTKLATPKFGSPYYERWAVVWGRIEFKSPASLFYRGDGAVFFFADP